MPRNKQERPATKKNESQRAETTSNALIWIQMTTDTPGDMIRMQNPNQAKRCLPEMVGTAIFIPERRIPSRTLLQRRTAAWSSTGASVARSVVN